MKLDKFYHETLIIKLEAPELVVDITQSFTRAAAVGWAKKAVAAVVGREGDSYRVENALMD